MRFRTEDLKNYLKGKIDWRKITRELTLRSFETSYENGILDVDILPNRYPDSASLIGLAKEISALTQLSLILPKYRLKLTTKNYKNFDVKVKTDLANYYFGRIILNVINRPSPQWLKEFVEFYGFNSINFLVDLSNFVMIECGAPLHIFDLEKITGKVIVRTAKKGEKFVSLDAKEYILEGEEIVIADEKDVIGLAGIKGGKKAEIDLETKNIFIEAAVFEPAVIYRTSRKLDLKTDASFRFERKIAPIRSLLALDRLSYLIQKNLGGEILVKVFGKKQLKEKRIIFNFNKVEKLTDLKINQKEMIKILNSLNIKTNKNILTIPPDRLDLETEEDVVEEIIRIYNLNKIQPVFEGNQREVFVENIIEFNNYLKKILTKAGYSEAWNYSFIGGNEENNNLSEILNPLSENYKYFQNTLIYNLIRAAYLNQPNYKEIKIFEINKIADKNLNERYSLGIVCANENKEEILKELKGILGLIEKELELKFNLKEIRSNLFEIVAQIFHSQNNNLGIIGLIQKEILEKYLVDLNVGIIELNINNLEKSSQLIKIYQPLGQFPPISRDISFIINEKIKFNQIKNSLKQIKINYLKEVELIDIYFPQSSQNLKSMTLRFVFQHSQRSLTHEEINQEMEKIQKILKEKFNIILR